MTQPCDMCSQPSETPTCARCLGFQAWAGSDVVGAAPKRLAKAKAELEALPGLVDVLARCLTEVPADAGTGSRGKPGSKPPMRLDVVHLVDTREKPLWWGEDPRVEDLGDRYGVVWSLHAWSRVVWEQMPDADFLADVPTVTTEVAYLLASWPWIGQQQWADELCDDVAALARNCRQGLGIRPPPQFSCPECGNRAVVVAGGFLTCTEGHDTNIRDLEGRYRRRPPLPTRDICSEFHLSGDLLRHWKARGKIKPMEPEGRGLLWFPWDVYCLLNPEVAAAFAMRDAAEAS